MKFELVTPTCMVAEVNDATYVQCPGTEGYFGVLPGHAPLVATLADAGQVTVKTTAGEQTFSVAEAFAEVSSTGVTILAEQASSV